MPCANIRASRQRRLANNQAFFNGAPVRSAFKLSRVLQLFHAAGAHAGYPVHHRFRHHRRPV